MQITSNHPVRVSGPTNIKNLGTGTLYYDSTQDVSSSNNEGSLTTNQSVDLADDKYVISSAISDILIDPYSRLAPLDLLGGTSGTVIGSDGLPVSVVSNSPSAITGVTYDASGNILTITEGGVASVFTYNADSTVHTELRLGVTRTFAYDAGGNLTGATVA